MHPQQSEDAAPACYSVTLVSHKSVCFMTPSAMTDAGKVRAAVGTFTGGGPPSKPADASCSQRSCCLAGLSELIESAHPVVRARLHKLRYRGQPTASGARCARQAVTMTCSAVTRRLCAGRSPRSRFPRPVVFATTQRRRCYGRVAVVAQSRVWHEQAVYRTATNRR
jgi:hypothetical protein